VYKMSTGRLKPGFLIKGFLIVVLSCLLQVPAQARDLLSMFGLEISPGNSYAYAGFIAPITDTHFGSGWVQRYWLDWLTYEYGNNRITKATAPGASAALGYTRSGSDYRYTTYLGLGYRRTNLSPDDPGNNAQGDRLGVVVQVDGEKTLPLRWKAEAIVSFETADSGYWSRLRLIRDTGRLINIGSEFILQGNLEYTSWQAGIIGTGLKIDSSTELGLKAGLRHNSNEGASSYFGFEVTRNW